jgi:hypothetical protein
VGFGRHYSNCHRVIPVLPVVFSSENINRKKRVIKGNRIIKERL